MIPYEHTAGVGWARFFAWVGLVLGAASLIVAFTVPLAAEFGRVAGVAFFGGFAVWFALMGAQRFRDAEQPRSWVATTGLVLGVTTFAIMAYAMVALIVAFETGVVLPMAPNWIAGTPGPGVFVPSVDV
ncbi:hypothetical protein [Agromyces sp. NPDC058110]|uniref:hypothetical protein n=1 Tax=Agromyces sp. NPDC058110 TaxID=3346345 RepID=UPI0036DAFBF4